MSRPSVEAMKGPQGPPLRFLYESENATDINAAISNESQPGLHCISDENVNDTDQIPKTTINNATQNREQTTPARGKRTFFETYENMLAG